MIENSAQTMQRARIAIRKGALADARRLLRQAVRDDPQNHAAWLLLAKVTPSPEAAAEYVRRANAVRPGSPLIKPARTELERREMSRARAQGSIGRRMVLLLGGLVILLGLLAAAFGTQAWNYVSALGSDGPVGNGAAVTPLPTAERPIVAMAAPSATPELLPTPTIRPTREVEEVITEEPTATEEAIAAATEEGVSIDAAVAVDELPLEEPTATVTAVPADDPMGVRPSGVGPAERWIDVNLTSQTLVAYEGNEAVYRTLISSGTQDYPTVLGQYRTYAKYERQDMNGYLLGYDYYLEDVPYVMYFFGDYAIHGTYWHANFGVPMSHGCVNTSPEDAGWLFDWAPMGTTVNIHY